MTAPISGDEADAESFNYLMDPDQAPLLAQSTKKKEAERKIRDYAHEILCAYGGCSTCVEYLQLDFMLLPPPFQ